MTAPPRSHTSKARRRSTQRDPPFPNSILDRKALEVALDDANISIKKQHLDSFYQGLHRQHYPSLSDFVETYYHNETMSKKKQQQNNLLQPSPPTQVVRPLKNKLSMKKNRNKVQLPKVLLDFLGDPNNGFVTITSTTVDAKTSTDGSTTKLAIQLHDGHVIESVIMRYNDDDDDGGRNRRRSRASLCVSSQVGCAMGCTFCATATMGIKGNLTVGEILEQIVHANHMLATTTTTQQQDSITATIEVAKKNQNHDTTTTRSTTKENCATTTTTNVSNVQNNNNKSNKQLDLVRNVVFMGMGEPLNNYDNVVEACRGLVDRKRWNLAHGRVTVSTVGVTPRIRDLTADLPQVCLALSLHAPNQQLRSTIVPAARTYNIEGLIDALDRHMMAGCCSSRTYDNGVAEYTREERIKESTRRKAMIEYVMLEGDTSTLECAHQLGKLCENRCLVVNLIPYNQTDVKDKLRCPSEEHMREFQRIVCSYGAFCTIRRTMGADIASACGQLVVKKEKKDHPTSTDIEDGPFIKGSKTQTKTATQHDDIGNSAKSQAKQHVQGDDHGRTLDDDNDLCKWIMPLAIATSAAASLFLASGFVYLSQKRRR